MKQLEASVHGARRTVQGGMPAAPATMLRMNSSSPRFRSGRAASRCRSAFTTTGTPTTPRSCTTITVVSPTTRSGAKTAAAAATDLNIWRRTGC